MPTHVVFKPLKGAFKNISVEDAQQMLAAGRAYQPAPKLSPGVYYEKVPDAPVAAPEPEPEPVREQTYETRTMEAAKPAAPRRRTYRKTGTPKD